MLGLFSMAGIPPLNGFFAKFFLFYEAYQNSFFLLVIVGMSTSLISAYYYLSLINQLNQKKKSSLLNIQTFLISNIIIVFSCVFITASSLDEIIFILISNKSLSLS